MPGPSEGTRFGPATQRPLPEALRAQRGAGRADRRRRGALGGGAGGAGGGLPAAAAAGDGAWAGLSGGPGWTSGRLTSASFVWRGGGGGGGEKEGAV